MRIITIILSLLLMGSAFGVFAQNIEMQPAAGGKLVFMPAATDTAFSITPAKTMRFTPGTGKILIGALGSDFELPKARGTAGQVLTYNGTTNVAEWVAPASAPTGTANAFALFDGSGNFTGTSGPLWDNSFKQITLGTAGAPSVSGYSGLILSSGTGSQLQLTSLGITVSTPANTALELTAGTRLDVTDSTFLRGGVRIGALGVPTWYKLPGSRGGTGDVLYSNGTGGTYWSTPPASTSLSGTDGQLTYKAGTNNLNTATGLTWDFANGRLGIGTNAPAQLLHVNGDAKVTGHLDGASMSLSSSMSVAGAASFTSNVEIQGQAIFNTSGNDFSLPGTRGTSGQVLTSNGIGQSDWATPTPGLSLNPASGTQGELLMRTTNSTEITTGAISFDGSDFIIGNYSNDINLAFNTGGSYSGKLSFGSPSTTTEISGNSSSGITLSTAANAPITLNYGTGGYVQVGSYSLPTGLGTSGQVLTTDGTGSTNWAAASGGATGAVNEMAYFGAANTVSGASNLQFDNTNSAMILGSATVGASISALNGLTIGGIPSDGPVVLTSPANQSLSITTGGITASDIEISGGESNNVNVSGSLIGITGEGNVTLSSNLSAVQITGTTGVALASGPHSIAIDDVSGIDVAGNTNINGTLWVGGLGTGYLLPNGRGNSGEMLTTDGVGGTTWTPAGGGATVAIGTVSSTPYLGTASVTNSGTVTNAIFDFTLVEGPPGMMGAQGPEGASPTLSVGTVGPLAYGLPPTVSITGVSPNYIIDFEIPEGAPATIPAGAPNAVVFYNIDGTSLTSSSNLTYDGAMINLTGNQSILGNLTVTGNLTYTGTLTGPSDIRYKKNIELLPNALTNILSLEGVQYDWKQAEFPHKNFPSGKSFGIIAQELEVVYPELVTTDAEGYKAVNYNGLIPVLLEAIKEQQRIIEAQNGKIETLEASQSSVQTQLFALKQQMDQLTRLMEATSTTAKQD